MLPTRTGSTDTSDPDEVPEERDARALTAPAGLGGPRATLGTPEPVLVSDVFGSTEVDHGAGQAMPLGHPMTASVRPLLVQVDQTSSSAAEGGDKSEAMNTTRLGSSVLHKEKGRQQESLLESGTIDKPASYTVQADMPRNFRVSVDGYMLLHDEDGTFAAYRINVTAGLHQWQVLRRYRQFISLHQAVSQHVGQADMPHLPGKRILGSSIDPTFAEARGLALQVRLRLFVGQSEADGALLLRI